MATRIYASEKFEVYKVTDADDRTILPLGYWSLRDPFATANYMTMGNIYLIVDLSKPLITRTFDFAEERDQVIAFLLASNHYRNRLNEPFNLRDFLEANSELKEIDGLKQDLEQHPPVMDFWNY